MKVFCVNAQTALVIREAQAESLVRAFLLWKEVVCQEVSLYLVDRETMSQLHALYFEDPTPTDCISFPMDSVKEMVDYRVLGDVFVCPEVALEYSQKHSLSPLTELSLYIIHGLLHLLGYDDEYPSERLVMRTEENSAIEYLEGIGVLLS